MLLKLYRTFTVSLAIAATASALNLESASEDQSLEGYENDDVQTLAETYGESVVMKPLPNGVYYSQTDNFDDDEEGTSSEECDDEPAKVEKPSLADVVASATTGKPAEVKKTDKSPAAAAAGTAGTSSD